MSITYNNMIVTKVVTENDYYDTNKKKHIKYKKPKITKTKIYEGSPSNNQSSYLIYNHNSIESNFKS